MQLKMDLEAIESLMQSAFPQAAQHIEVVDIAPMTAVLRMPVSDKQLRPGGTVSDTLCSIAVCYHRHPRHDRTTSTHRHHQCEY